MNGCLRAARTGADLNKMSNDISSPLFAAVGSGHKDVVELLVSAGAEVHEIYGMEGWTCLHQAVEQGHSEIVKFLLSVYSLESLDDGEITPLFVAAQYGYHHCLEILLNSGANVNCQAEDMATPLFFAAQEGHLSCVELLLAHNADPNLYSNKDQWQLPIHAAAKFGRISVVSDFHQIQEIMKMLLADGAHVSLATYILALHSCVPEHLSLILEYAGLPKGMQLKALVQAALGEVAHASFWLPMVLKAGLDPLCLLQQKMLEEVESSILNFLLEFINWKTLPSILLRILSQRRADGTWRPHKHFECVPDLTHLCRLAVRATVGSDALSKPSFVQQLPVPALLHDYLQFNDISSTYTFKASSNQESAN